MTYFHLWLSVSSKAFNFDPFPCLSLLARMPYDPSQFGSIRFCMWTSKALTRFVATILQKSRRRSATEAEFAGSWLSGICFRQLQQLTEKHNVVLVFKSAFLPQISWKRPVHQKPQGGWRGDRGDGSFSPHLGLSMKTTASIGTRRSSATCTCYQEQLHGACEAMCIDMSKILDLRR